MFILVRILFIDFCRWSSYRGVIDRSLSWMDEKRCVPITSAKSILVVIFLLLGSLSPSVFRELVVTFCRSDCATKISVRLFSEVAYIQLIYRPIAGITAIQKTLLMMWNFGRNLPVSFSVFLGISTFEIESESCSNMFHVSGYFCTVGFGVMLLLIFKRFRNTCFYQLSSLLSNI